MTAKIAPLLGLTVVVALLLVPAYGFSPSGQAPRFSVQPFTVGIPQYAVNTGNLLAFDIPNVGFPAGVRPPLGYPFHVAVALLAAGTGCEVLLATQLVGAATLLVGVLALYLLALRFSRSVPGALAAVLCFYFSPFLFGMSGFNTIYHAFLLMPAWVLAGLSLPTRITARLERRDWAGAGFFSALLFLTYLLAASLDGYSYVMAAVTTAILATAEGTRSDRKPGRLVTGVGLGLSLALIGLAGLCYSAVAFHGVDKFGESMDFYRGHGIDLLTIVVPTISTWAADLIGVAVKPWDAQLFWGDGNNARYNFLGPVTLALPLVALALAWRRRTRQGAPDSRAVLALAAIILVGFLMSLGPSLKIASTSDKLGEEVVGHRSYLMPKEAALFSLPTAPLYRLPILRSMRAVSRWQLMTRLGLALATSIGIALVWRRSRWWALPLLVVLAAETVAAEVVNRGRPFTVSYQHLKAFNESALPEIQSVLRPAERVLFLPAYNDYLIYSIMAEGKTFTYNVGWDKALVEARRSQSNLIRDAIRRYETQEMGWEHLLRLFDENLVDQVVLLRFSLRWGAQKWPPPDSRMESLGRRIEGLGEPPAELVVEDHRYFQSVRRR